MINNIIFILWLMPALCLAQPNCNIYKLNNNEPCYVACELAVAAADDQGTYKSQEEFYAVIKLCPSFDYAYREKSVPYLKRGNFIEWVKLMDKAVELDARNNLGYRGWCRYQFLRDYEGAIQDFIKLDSISGNNIGYSQNGDYHLKIVLALCYKALGNRDRAIHIIEDQLNRKGYLPMPYDYLHLGVLYLEAGDLQAAEATLNKQIAYNDYLADTYYYLAMTNKKTGDENNYLKNLLKAKDFYMHNKKRMDPYTHPMDKIYLKTIEDELKLTTVK